MLTRRTFLGAFALPMLGLTSLKEHIAIQPLRPYAPWSVDVMRTSLADICGYAVSVREERPIPESARDFRRGRYHAPSVVATLGDDLVLGITDADICQPHHHPKFGYIPDWGLIGVAQLGGPAGVISTRRVRDRSWLPVIVVHEIGHLRGYAHCETPGCQMIDVQGDGDKYLGVRYGWFCARHAPTGPDR